MKQLLLIILSLSISIPSLAQSNQVSGYVRDASSGESIIGAVVFSSDKKYATVTDDIGLYTLSLPLLEETLICQCIGYETMEARVSFDKGDVTLDFSLESSSTQLEASKLVATSQRDILKLPQMGMNTMDISIIKKIPSLMGETDVIRAIQMLPGVQAPSEGSTGFSVRGGGIDGNLILIDGAPLYNSGHFLGFFSMFNGDAIKNVKLYKGDFPAKYGEKSASVLDISTVDGNMNELDGNVSIGLLTSKVFVEAPIVKQKLSFALAARRSYVDLFFPLLGSLVPDGTQVYFGDINLKFNWAINDKNRLNVSAFTSKDALGIGLEDMGVHNMGLSYKNNVQSIKWTHVISPNVNLVINGYNSRYDMGTSMDMDKAGYKWDSVIRESGVKTAVNFHFRNNNNMEFGLNCAYFIIEPSNTHPVDDSVVMEEISPMTHAVQPSVYWEDQQKLGPVTIRAGLRLVDFLTMGDCDVYYYDNDHKREKTVHFGKGEKIIDYFGIDPRLSVSYAVKNNLSVKASYSRTNQFIKQTSVSLSPGVLDVWYACSPTVKPMVTDQLSAGANLNLLEDALRISVEAFYKLGHNVSDLKDNPGQVIENVDREALLRFGKSTSYGLESMVEMEFGKFEGWVGYTWSRCIYNIKEINNGKPYRSPLNHEHSLNAVAMYHFTKRLDASISWIFYSGAPTTFPVGRFNYGESYVPIYKDKNVDNMPDYHRLDASVTLVGKKRAAGQRFGGEWNFSVYNAYGRHNAWSMATGYNRKKEEMETIKVYLFSVVPSVSYTLYF